MNRRGISQCPESDQSMFCLLTRYIASLLRVAAVALLTVCIITSCGVSRRGIV